MKWSEVSAGYGLISVGYSATATVQGDYALNYDWSCTVKWDIKGVGGGGALRNIRAVLLTNGAENHTKEYFCDYEGVVKTGCTAWDNEYTGQFVASGKGFAWAWNAANQTGGSYPTQWKFCFQPSVGAKAWNYDTLPVTSIQDTLPSAAGICIDLAIHYADNTSVMLACSGIDLVTASAPLPGCA